MNPTDGNTFNHDELLARCVGRLDFMERILNSFELRFGEDLEQLEEHLKSSDADEVARIAHKMKGTSANVAAPCLNVQIAEIEQLARSQRLDEIPEHIKSLHHEWSRFSQTVSSIIHTESSEKDHLASIPPTSLLAGK